MGFPVGYTKVCMPKVFVHTISFLGFLRSVVVSFFTVLGLSDFIDTAAADNIWHDYSPPPRPRMLPSHHHHARNPHSSAVLIREIVPVVKFEDLALAGEDRPEICAVCLYDFEGGDEIRWLESCRHVFHRACLDRWMDHDRSTCPLCRSSLVQEEMKEELDRRLWGDVADFYSTVPIF